tara:strand:- start:502 stop:2016 length:1515 start_codon:yes stop_codon:yes gene_type:complete
MIGHLIKKKIHNLLNVMNFDDNENFFINKNKLKIKKFDSEKKNIFIEISQGYYYFCYYNNLLNSGKFDKYNIIGIWTHVHHPLKKLKFLQPFVKFYYIFYNFFRKRKFYNLYRSIGVSKFLDISNTVYFKKKSLFLNNKKELFNIKYQGIVVGDLIYDTYLRFRSFPTLRIRDEFINLIYSKICIIYEKLELYRKNYKPKFYFANATAYVDHGLLYRYFLKKKIPVVSGTISNSYNRLISLENIQGFYDFKNYKSNFKKLDKKNKRIRESRLNLLKRFSGKNQFKIDAQYMEVDPYSKNANYYFPKEEFKKKKIKGVLFLQDFFDAPAAWGQNIFEDFYLWTLYTLMIIKKYNLPIAIKPHPNAPYFYTDTVKITNNLKKKYSDLLWLNPKTSNKIIFSNIEYGISATGSIIFELAYHKIKSLSCGRHPAEKFNFSINAKSKSDYKRLLINIGKIKKNKFSKDDLYIFNYMHYLSDQNLFNLKTSYKEFKKNNFSKSSCLRKDI